MKLLVIDGNSILNRAFYGIKLLTTKDGTFTNGIYGFLKILFKLEDMCSPDAVAVAFDVKKPTFRHKMYDAYKAGRHAMPEELRSQMPVLKELLCALGYKTVECEGWEADDILGTLAQSCREKGDECFIATGDRDSLQLAFSTVKVLLAATKGGKAVTTEYDEKLIMEEYGVTPQQLIDVKALQGDSSDNIPGVAGIGQKTALDLISRFGSVDNIYSKIDEIDVKEGVRNKLKNGRESAYMSRQLGEISCKAPIDTNISSYVRQDYDKQQARAMLARLEMFKFIEELGLSDGADDIKNDDSSETVVSKTFAVEEIKDTELFYEQAKGKTSAFLADISDGEVGDIYFCSDEKVYVLRYENAQYEDFIKKFMSDESIAKVTYDVKAVSHTAISFGCDVKNIKSDILLAAYVLNPSSSNYELSRLFQEYNVPVAKIENAMGEENQTAAFAASLEKLAEKLEQRLEENDQLSLFRDIEIPLACVLARMETEGFEVDVDGIKEFGTKLQSRIKELTDEIYDHVGYEFNINSPKQLGQALFEKLLLPVKKKTKSGYSTNAEVLESLRDEHPVINLILEYRTLSKLKSTYCDGLIKTVSDDGRIHTSFNQIETRTGRLSSTEPNLQNIPVRSELGREMRRFFKAKDGCVLIDADYSQIELRVLADLANDENMINAFNNNDDIHAITASQVFNLPLEMVTPMMRSRAKAVNFGIVYGIGAFSLAKDIGVTRKEADSYIKGYLEHYKGVSDFMEKVIEQAKERGYALTLFGRRRYLPELTASNAMLRAFGERVARNMPIQGTAADIIKIAMIKVDKRLAEENMKSKLIMQVHDELIVESPYDEAEKALKIVVDEMENACAMKVKLLADGNIGKTWYDAKG